MKITLDKMAEGLGPDDGPLRYDLEKIKELCTPLFEAKGWVKVLSKRPP